MKRVIVTCDRCGGPTDETWCVVSYHPWYSGDNPCEAKPATVCHLCCPCSRNLQAWLEKKPEKRKK